MRYYQTIKGKFFERLTLSGGRYQLDIKHITRPGIGRHFADVTRSDAAAWIKARRRGGRLYGPITATGGDNEKG